MADGKKSYFNIPKLDFSYSRKQFTEEEIDQLCDEFEKSVDGEGVLRLVEAVERNPASLLSWDADISFEEFARRVREGDHG